jgi:O-antigen ligase
MKNIIYFCFLFPLISNILNLQAFIALFINDVIGLYFAYINLSLITLGILLLLNKTGPLSRTSKLWFFFYMFYYSFGILAMELHSNYTPLIRTFIPVLYFFGFFMFLSINYHRELFLKTAAISFLITSFLLIYFVKINFDLDSNGISLYKLDRPGGVYGDANNAALASIITYIFFNKFYTPKNTATKYLKIFIILIISYSVFLTFSTTGMFAFMIILFVTNLNFFTKERIILLFISLFLVITAVVNLKKLTADMDLTPGQRLKIDTLVNVVSLNTKKVNNSGRGELLENLLKFVYENPILGNGIDFGSEQHGHNTYIGIWADAGIFTFLLFIIILIIFISKSLKANKNIRYFNLSLMIALCIFMMSLQTIINQPYLIVLFPYMGYLIDENLETQTIK